MVDTTEAIPVEASILRLFGGVDWFQDKKDSAGQPEPCPASYQDAIDVITAMCDPGPAGVALRARAETLSHLVNDADPLKRQEAARALAILMTNEVEPLVLAPKSKGDYVATTHTYTSLVAPLPNGRWKDHVNIKYRSTGGAEWAKLSPYMAEAVMAFENLLGCRGHMVQR